MTSEGRRGARDDSETRSLRRIGRSREGGLTLCRSEPGSLSSLPSNEDAGSASGARERCPMSLANSERKSSSKSRFASRRDMNMRVMNIDVML